MILTKVNKLWKLRGGKRSRRSINGGKTNGKQELGRSVGSLNLVPSPLIQRLRVDCLFQVREREKFRKWQFMLFLQE
jgi:hypothetical protein